MVQWLTDFPKMNYSASDRPQIFQENEIIQSTSILPWGGPPAFIQDPGRNQRELGSSPTSSEWVCSSEAAAEVVPFCCFQESFAGRQSERKALFLDPSRWLTSPLPIDRAANSKWALHCGKIWQLRLDAIAVDAPEDYRARIRTVYWDVLEAAEDTAAHLVAAAWAAALPTRAPSADSRLATRFFDKRRPPSFVLTA